MLIGYVSDERYVAVPEVLLEFEGEAGHLRRVRGRLVRFMRICLLERTE